MFRSPDLLSKRGRQILQLMADTDDYIITDRLSAWVGDQQIHWRTLNHFIDLCFVSQDSMSPGVWWINESGRRFLDGKPPYRCENGHDHDAMVDVWNCSEQSRKLQHDHGPKSATSGSE